MVTVDVLRVLIAARGLLATGGAARAGFGSTAGPPARTTVRVLAVRQAVQAVVVSGSGWRALSAGIDVLHATSMVGLLVVAPRRAGRFALTQIATAAVLAALEVVADRRA